MKIYLDKVSKDDKNILYRLLQYSLFEESLNDGNEMKNDATFEYQYFDNYFRDTNRNAFFIKEQETNKLLGFVMINTHMKNKLNGHSIAEFMVIPKYRKNKIGKDAAFKCFDMYNGIWEVSPSFGSTGAYIFWKKVIDEYTNGENEFNDGTFMFCRD